MESLLAKSGEGAPTLEEHTRDVMDTAEALFGGACGPTRLGECWLRFFRIPDVQWSKFHGNLLAACGLHDWGKANDGFQKTMLRRGQQAIRHEHFSALLLAQPACWDWLATRPDLDRMVILSAVLTHHLKAREDASKLYGFATPENGAKCFHSMHDNPEFSRIVEAVAGRIGLTASPDLSSVPGRWVFDGPGVSVDSERKRMKRVLHCFRRDLGTDLLRRRFLHAVRSALVAADAAGSGLRRTGQSIHDWVQGTFDESRLWNGASVRENVIEPRTRQVELLKRGPFKWTDFQDHCADPNRVPVRALLLAPCGSGKTLAAWRWIEEQAKGQVGHVLFLYPTRATATEGFRDYVSWAPEAEAALMHGTSGFDLDGMFDNGDDPRRENKYEAERKLFALGYWGRRAFSATVDQFLAFLQYGYGPVCMLPVLADSVVVIDEVHSFDNKMFAALKAFLTEFDVPVLCMTATLPTNRRDDLTKSITEGGCGLKAYPDGELPPELREVAQRKRYRLRQVASREDAERAVRDALKANKRVLWVVNQVKRAHAVVARFVKELPTDTTLKTADNIPVYCYHSRFRLSDRVARHKALMKALKDELGPALGVTTQVCEMSLDIDVDLLVTEDCPVTALVQRMGRCNRAQTPQPLGEAGDVLVYRPKEIAPYCEGDLTGLTAFLDAVNGKDLSQDDLEQAMRNVDSPPSLGDPLCSFLASGPYAVGGEEDFRNSEEFNRQCVLPNDITEYLRAGRDQQPGFVVPVPKKLSRGRDNTLPDHDKLPAYLGVANDAHYHPAVGFCDWLVNTPLTEWRAD